MLFGVFSWLEGCAVSSPLSTAPMSRPHDATVAPPREREYPCALLDVVALAGSCFERAGGSDSFDLCPMRSM
jgi:hypothetical protein